MMILSPIIVKTMIIVFFFVCSTGLSYDMHVTALSRYVYSA
jgi:hypothetical protein